MKIITLDTSGVSNESHSQPGCEQEKVDSFLLSMYVALKIFPPIFFFFFSHGNYNREYNAI